MPDAVNVQRPGAHELERGTSFGAPGHRGLGLAHQGPSVSPAFGMMSWSHGLRLPLDWRMRC